MLPGRTLSGSDTLLSSVPWQASKPADVPGLGTNFELADSADVFQPMLQYTRSQLPTVPLWNPYIMAGRPLLADGQSAVFSPFSVVSYVLPFWKSLAVVAMLKLFLGAFGAYLLGRLLGMRFGGALVTGLVFAFGTFFVVWLAWPLTSVYAWIPWALAACELLIRRPGRLSVAALAAVVGLQFLGGHPESSFHLMFVLVVFFAFRALLDWRRRRLPARALVRPTVAFVIAMVAGTALAALVLAPLVEFVLHSGDLSRRANAAAGYWPRKYLGALFLHDYWGRPTQLDLAAFMQVRGWYAGAATLMLAAAALILRRTAERIAVVVFALFCVCMVVGIKPVFGLVSGLPGFSAAHNERLLIYFLLCVALLAGWGIDDLSAVRLPRPSLRRAVLISAGAIVCVPIVWLVVAGTLSLSELGGGLRVAWGFEHPPLPASGLAIPASTGAIVRDSALLIWLPLAGAAFALIAARLWGSRRLGVDAVRGADRDPAGRGPVSGEHGLQPGDHREDRGAADDRRDPLPAVTAAQPLHRREHHPAQPAAARRPGDALRPVRRARLRLPGREALRRSVAGQRRAGRRRLHPARGVRERDAGGAARAEPAERLRSPGGTASGDRHAAARTRAARRLQGQGRRRLRQRQRAPARVRGRPPADGCRRQGRAGGGHRARVRRTRRRGHRASAARDRAGRRRPPRRRPARARGWPPTARERS